VENKENGRDKSVTATVQKAGEKVHDTRQARHKGNRGSGANGLGVGRRWKKPRTPNWLFGRRMQSRHAGENQR